jgi:hypothetical protein
VLLGWNFHAIFLNEASAAARQGGIDWQKLSRAEQWQGVDVRAARVVGRN